VGIVEIFLKNAITSAPAAKKESTSKYDGAYRIPDVFQTEPANPKRDNRTTLLWIPEQKVDETGQFEFTVTAGKVVSDFVIDIQGMTPDGRLGSGNAVISVTK
jgi:hypothetical protein